MHIDWTREPPAKNFTDLLQTRSMEHRLATGYSDKKFNAMLLYFFTLNFFRGLAIKFEFNQF